MARQAVTGGDAGKPGRVRSAKEREVPIQVMVPASVRRQVGVIGAERGENLRTIVLRALRSIGVEIPNAELCERRGRRVGTRGGLNGTK